MVNGMPFDACLGIWSVSVLSWLFACTFGRLWAFPPVFENPSWQLITRWNPQLISLVWPFIASSSRNVRISNNRTIPSPPAVATKWPSGPHFVELTVDLWECLYRWRGFSVDQCCSRVYLNLIRNTHSVLKSLPVLGSQNLTNKSLLPETTRPFVGCQSTHLTSHPWPGSFIPSHQSPPRSRSWASRSGMRMTKSPSDAPTKQPVKRWIKPTKERPTHQTEPSLPSLPYNSKSWPTHHHPQ